MAAFDTTRNLNGASTSARISHMMTTFFGAVSDWNDARITRNSLSTKRFIPWIFLL